MVNRSFTVSAAVGITSLLGLGMFCSGSTKGSGTGSTGVIGELWAAAQSRLAPPIRIDQVRPHEERGACANCHVILPAANAAPAQGRPLPAGAAPWAAGAQPLPLLGPTPTWSAAAPATTAAAQLDLTQPVRATSVTLPNAPAIVEGTPPPHAWRGACVNCHVIIPVAQLGAAQLGAAPQPAAALAPAFVPTAPLAALANAARRDPPETEALGMAVRPTSAGVGGMMVVEVEGLARRAGLKLGDVIRALDGKLTGDIPAFTDAARGADPGRGIVVDLVRDGQPLALVLK